VQDAKKNLGRVVRAARQDKNMTQEQLAEKLGVQPRMILEIENGRGNPRFDSLYPLLRLLDIPPNEVFNADRIVSEDAEKFFQELSAFSDQEQRLALAAARAVMAQLRQEKESESK